MTFVGSSEGMVAAIESKKEHDMYTNGRTILFVAIAALASAVGMTTARPGQAGAGPSPAAAACTAPNSQTKPSSVAVNGGYRLQSDGLGVYVDGVNWRGTGSGSTDSAEGEGAGESGAGRLRESRERATSSCFLWEGLQIP